MVDSRNPYVILGVPYGSPKDVATRAFARRAKGRRREASSSGPALTELTWALNQVAECIRDPRSALHVYRVPANPAAFEPDADGVLRPGPELLARTSDDSAQAWAELLEAARVEAVGELFRQIAATVTRPAR